jgi:hypothetical protein
VSLCVNARDRKLAHINFFHAVSSSRCAVSEQKTVLPARDVDKVDTRSVLPQCRFTSLADNGLHSVYLKNRSVGAVVMPKPKQCTFL